MNYVVPASILFLFLYAAYKKVDCYEAFVEGARDALPTLIKLLPNLAAMLAVIGLFRASGAAELIAGMLATAFETIGLPCELAPLIILRPFSGSGALAMLSDLLNEYGADSFVGLCACVCVGSTETIFYTITIYCGAVGIKKTRYALPAALISGIVGTISAIALVRFMFFFE